MQCLVAPYSTNIIAEAFNYVLLKVSENELLDIFTDDVQMVNDPTNISESLVDHVYIKKSLMEEFFTNATAENVYFSDHVTVRVIIEKMLLIFVLFHKIKYDEAREKNLLF